MPERAKLKLYDRVVRDLAHAGHGAGELPAASHRAHQSNPMCGDEILLCAQLTGGRIVELAHHTRGCLLCQASASLLALLSRRENGNLRVLGELGSEFESMLNGGPQAAALAMFAPVADHPSRRLCVLLPWRAIATLQAN